MLVNNTIALQGQPVATPNLLGMANTAARTKNILAQTEIDQSQEERAQYSQAIKQSRDALSFINTPEQYLAWSDSNYSDPILGSMLTRMGSTPEKTRSTVMAELQKPGGLQRLIQQSASSADQLVSSMQGQLNQMAADRRSAAANAQTAQQQAAVQSIMGGQSPVITQDAPANAMVQGAPAPARAPVNMLSAPPAGAENASMGAPVTTTASPADVLINQIGQLRQAAALGNPRANEAANTLEKQLKLIQDQAGGLKLSDRFVPVGKNVFDRENQQFIEPPTPEDVDSLKPQLQKGERWNAEEGRVDAVPGSKIYVEQSQKHAKSKQAYDTTNLKVNQMNEKIAEILADKNADAFSGNFGGYNASATRLLPGENSNLRMKINSLKANMKGVGLELIRSGGSIGQMTEKEWPIVEQMLGAIDPVLGEEDARLEFQKVQARINNILENAKNIYQDEWSNTQYYKPTKDNANKPTLTGQDAQAAEWAKANPNDPRSAEIKRRLGL